MSKEIHSKNYHGHDEPWNPRRDFIRTLIRESISVIAAAILVAALVWAFSKEAQSEEKLSIPGGTRVMFDGYACLTTEARDGLLELYAGGYMQEFYSLLETYYQDETEGMPTCARFKGGAIIGEMETTPHHVRDNGVRIHRVTVLLPGVAPFAFYTFIGVKPKGEPA